MPPRWPRQPSRRDPEFRRLDDRFTFGAHLAIFLTVGSGLTFFDQLLQAHWAWLQPVGGWWGIVVGLHALVVLVLLRYDKSGSSDLIEMPPLEDAGED
jgi:cytochrome c biogenesis protein CcdA